MNKKALVIHIINPRKNRLEKEYLDELLYLADGAGFTIVEIVKQKVAAPRAPFYIGKGKLQEIKEIALDKEVETVIFGVNNLSPSFKHKIEDFLKLEVIDRTRLTLAIFEAHASSKESKIQVELALLRYELPRLKGKGEELSRLGGGIATRGPGEMEIEKERRIIRKRVNALEKSLKTLLKNRDTMSKSRKKQNIPLVSIIGYTSAGKTSLFNILTKSDFTVDSKPFTTLDPRVRYGYLGNNEGALFIDTVGFIRDLPMELFTAFKATFSEAGNADVLLLIVDVSQDNINEHIETIYKVLKDLRIEDKPSILLANKIDLLDNIETVINSIKAIYDGLIIPSSAISLEGINDLKQFLREKLTYANTLV